MILNTGKCIQVKDERGVLLGNDFKDLPFVPQRVVFLRFTNGKVRGDHASKDPQILQCLKGVVHVYLKDGKETSVELLSEGDWLQVPGYIWVVLSASCDCSMVAVYSPSEYSESNYIRSYDEFKKLKDNQIS